VVSRFRPDIIHAQGVDAAGYLAVKSGHPAVITVHGILSECAKYHTDAVRRVRDLLQSRITEEFVIGRADHILAISPYVARYYRNRLRGSVHDVPNAVAPSFYAVQRRPEQRRFLFAGRISIGKGLLDLVRAVSQSPLAADRIILAGHAPERDFEMRLRTAISESGCAERFELVGLLDEHSLLEEFARATALILPSYQETAPMVIQQAMAAGLPVIATPVGGIPDMIEHDVSGLLFHPGDVEGLARALHRLSDDAGLAARLASAARSRALSSFTAERVAKATLDVYRRVLATV
jgi:glycosyltransferase involved in cell wall biosynthesis